MTENPFINTKRKAGRPKITPEERERKHQEHIEQGRKAQLISAKVGGAIVRGRYVDENSPVAQTLRKCDDCAIREGCTFFLAKCRCHYQIENLKAEYKKCNALTSGNPLDLLKDIQTTIARLETAIKYEEMIGKAAKPSDLKELAFLKLQVYEMVYGKKPIVAQVNVQAPVMDVKALMEEARKVQSVEAQFESAKDDMAEKKKEEEKW